MLKFLLTTQLHFIKINHHWRHPSEHLDIDDHRTFLSIDLSHDSFRTREITILECDDITDPIRDDHCRSLIPFFDLTMKIIVFFVTKWYRMCLCTDNDPHSWRISDDIPDLIIHSHPHEDITRIEFLLFDDFLSCLHL